MAFDPELPMPQPDWLQRQTNEHELLSPRKKEQYLRAQTQEERDALLATISPLPSVVSSIAPSVAPSNDLNDYELTEEDLRAIKETLRQSVRSPLEDMEVNARMLPEPGLMLPRPALVRMITDIGPGLPLTRSTNEHERLRPDLRERFWSADAEEKAELLATLSPIESAFPELPAPLITPEEFEMMRAMRL
jgi:hypothetical protein